MAYFDPRDLGCRCDVCFLRNRRIGDPVPSEHNPNAIALVIGEAPGDREIEELRPFCLDAEMTLVLMADLTWKRLGEVQIGDHILTPSEEPIDGPGVSGKVGRKWEIASVRNVWRRRAECIQVKTEYGNLVGTPDHRMLVGGGRTTSTPSHWQTLGWTRLGRQGQTQFWFAFKPWVEERGYEAGWLAGFLDGEGHVLGSKSGRQKRLGYAGFSQNSGPVLQRAERAVQSFGFELNGKEEYRHKGTVCCRRQIAGGFPATLQFLGRVRSGRLLHDLLYNILGAPGTFKQVRMGRSKALSVEPVGIRDVIDIETTSGTFIANGFVAHNCGPSGNELMIGLGAIGTRRGELSFTNALACKPPGGSGNLERLMSDFRKDNEIRRKIAPVVDGKVMVERRPTPFECCWPRLFAEIKRYRNIITLGGSAMRTVLQTNRGIFDVRGGPVEGWYDPTGRFWQPKDYTATVPGTVLQVPEGCHQVRILPTVHPSLVLHARSWTQAFRVDLSRALRWFRIGLQWQDPEIIIRPSVEQLEAFLLGQRQPFWGWDLETEFDKREFLMTDPLTCRIRCIQFSTLDTAVVVPLLSIDRQTRFYSPDEEAAVIDVMVRFLADPTRTKTGWNSRYYDRMVVEAQWRAKVNAHIDLIILHRAWLSEVSHKLSYAGSTMTDAPAWKADHAGTEAKSDAELHFYGALDACVTARITPPLVEQVRLRGMQAVCNTDFKIQDICVGLHQTGMLVDQAKAREYDQKYEKEAAEHRANCRELFAVPKLNPNSVPQIRDLLFEKWKLPVQKETKKSGDPSTDDEVIRALMFLPGINPVYAQALDQLRRFRRAVKSRGLLRKLRPCTDRFDTQNDLAIDADVDPEAVGDEDRMSPGERESVLREAAKDRFRMGIVFPDGRIRPDYNAHGTTSRRLSSSNPNAQNVSAILRDFIIPQPGCCFVYADEDQLELRGVTNASGARNYMQVFLDKGDPHSMTVFSVFGKEGKAAYDEAIAKVGKKGYKDYPRFKVLRDFGKTFCYSSIYGAAVETVHQTIVSAEDEKGELIYRGLPLKVTRQRHRAWLDANPEIEKWWAATVALYRKQGYLTEPVDGWRRDFLDGEDFNELVNFGIQSKGAALVHHATIELVIDDGCPFPFGCYGPGTGLIQQGHDALVFELPYAVALRAMEQVTAAMTRTIPGEPVPYTAEAKIYRNWRDKACATVDGKRFCILGKHKDDVPHQFVG